MFGDEENAELREFVAPRRRQAQAIAASVGRLVRAGDEIERQGEVVDRARHRPDDGEIDRSRPGGQARRDV